MPADLMADAPSGAPAPGPMRRPPGGGCWPLLVAATVAASPGLGAAQPADAATDEVQQVLVSAERGASPGSVDAASAGTVTARQLTHRPLLRPAEVMEAVPGMVVTQHSGDGKANQYFLRGFNLDHGSDFATRLLGMPVNMPSHGHGQGYMDLNFLIPELVRSLQYRKGVYAAEDGDFATTGAARIDYQRQLARPFVQVNLGAHGYQRWLGATGGATGAAAAGGGHWLGAVEVAQNNGPWVQPEGLRKHNGVLRWAQGDADNGLVLSALAYRASWTATEHVPQRAIASGEIDRYGTLLPGDGGITHRHSLNAEWARADADGRSRGEAYLIDYGLNLFSAPSGFISGVQGDQHEQEDQRRVWGGQWQRQQALGPAWRDTELGLGLQWREDRIARLGLYDTVQRARTAVLRQDRVLERMASVFVDARTVWTPWLRSTLGLRLDRASARVTPLAGQFNADNGGAVQALQASPKLALVMGPFGGDGRVALFVNAGRGLHSNDARGATTRTDPKQGTAIDPVPLLVPASGAELGLLGSPWPGWTSQIALWWMGLGSELVFVGDEGVTEPRGASRRHGLEWSLHGSPSPAWQVDADLSWSRARFVQANPESGGRELPNAIPLTASIGLVWDPQGPFNGGLRWRYLGAYALEDTGQQRAQPFSLLNLDLGWRLAPGLRAGLQLLNLLNSRANDIEYWGNACSRADGPGCNAGQGLPGRLVHPLEPRTLRLTLHLDF